MQDLKKRKKQFAIDCWNLCSKLPHTREYNNCVIQLLKSSSSVGANYRAALRGKSTADFINKLKIVEEEADESIYWLEILMSITNEHTQLINKLHKEAKELLAITVASIKTSRLKYKN